jgi:hypothetical protein
MKMGKPFRFANDPHGLLRRPAKPKALNHTGSILGEANGVVNTRSEE